MLLARRAGSRSRPGSSGLCSMVALDGRVGWVLSPWGVQGFVWGGGIKSDREGLGGARHPSVLRGCLEHGGTRCRRSGLVAFPQGSVARGHGDVVGLANWILMVVFGCEGGRGGVSVSRNL